MNACLHPTTLEKLMPRLYNILITNQLDRIYIEAETLIHNEKIEGKNEDVFFSYSIEILRRSTYSIQSG